MVNLFGDNDYCNNCFLFCKEEEIRKTFYIIIDKLQRKSYTRILVKIESFYSLGG